MLLTLSLSTPAMRQDHQEKFSKVRCQGLTPHLQNQKLQGWALGFCTLESGPRMHRRWRTTDLKLHHPSPCKIFLSQAALHDGAFLKTALAHTDLVSGWSQAARPGLPFLGLHSRSWAALHGVWLVLVPKGFPQCAVGPTAGEEQSPEGLEP